MQILRDILNAYLVLTLNVERERQKIEGIYQVPVSARYNFLALHIFQNLKIELKIFEVLCSRSLQLERII